MKIDLPEHERALYILKTRGPGSVKELAGEMNVTVEGARFHLLKLEKEGLVESESVVEGRGRPKQIWSLTDKGNNRFPDAHADLTAHLIDMMRKTLGQEAVDRVIEANREDIMQRYAEELKGVESLEERVAGLAEIRSREGYMAEYEQDKEGFLLIENHCPICSAAQTCQGFCRAELQTFRKIIGDGATVERTEHIIEGARRCAYRIRPV